MRVFHEIPCLSFFIPALLIIVICAGCKENSSVSIQPSTPQNTPVIVSTSNTFTYALEASTYSANNAYDLVFSSDSLACTLAVGGYLSGDAAVYVRDSTGAVVFFDSITSNKAIVLTQTGKGVPRQFTMTCSDFTGKISFVLSRIR